MSSDQVRTYVDSYEGRDVNPAGTPRRNTPPGHAPEPRRTEVPGIAHRHRQGLYGLFIFNELWIIPKPLGSGSWAHFPGPASPWTQSHRGAGRPAPPSRTRTRGFPAFGSSGG